MLTQGLTWVVLCTVQERRLKAERTGQMIDLTKDVSPAVLAQTAAKLEAEQKQRDEDDAQKELAEARKPFEARMVSCLQSSCLLPMCTYRATVGTCRHRSSKSPWAALLSLTQTSLMHSKLLHRHKCFCLKRRSIWLKALQTVLIIGCYSR